MLTDDRASQQAVIGGALTVIDMNTGDAPLKAIPRTLPSAAGAKDIGPCEQADGRSLP
ncbi:hypothetical protein [Roseomonas fluvialis]|uniref:Uncharacterized protein n=1 Tax=Roseomonas fluvialis TaxID=1750527 RepID=A0ABM7XY95_9PROT|nr:hypothetical protein [Roseomonas fluvialis]BDG70474.1 hypothetical protein Rmf_04030 [Roseomonas fluvialis]